jgi:hypothetical protein
MSLFPLAYSGRLLEVTWETDKLLRDCFPEVDETDCYREADAWLWSAPLSRRPKNVRRFLRTWFVKEKRAMEREKLKHRTADELLGGHYSER